MLRITLKVLAALMIAGIVAIQFVRPDRINPPVDKAKSIEAVHDLPGDVAEILGRSCSDCHSNRTVWPWYSNIAPFSWSVSDHVSEGREELNFSEWGDYSRQRRIRKLKEICEEVSEGKMPHSQYVWIHREAALSETDVRVLCDWTEVLSKRLAAEG